MVPISFIPQNLEMKWIRYFEEMISRGYSMEELLNQNEVEDESEEEEDEFMESLSPKTPKTPKKECIGYSSVSYKWSKISIEKRKIALDYFNLISTPGKKGRNKAAPGSQEHSKTARNSIDKVVRFIRNLFGDDLELAREALFLNLEFKKSFTVVDTSSDPLLQLQEVTKNYDELKESLLKVQKSFRENLQTIYHLTNTSINEINKLFQFLRKLVSKISKPLSKQIVPCARDTYYRDEENKKVKTVATAKEYSKLKQTDGISTLDPVFICHKGGELSFSVKSQAKKIVKKTKKKKNATKKKKKNKIKRLEKKQNKDLLKEQEYEKECQKYDNFRKKFQEVKEESKKYPQIEELIQKVKKRVPNQNLSEFRHRLILVGRKQKNLVEKLKQRCPEQKEVCFVSTRTDATHVVVFSMTEKQKKTYEKCELKMMNSLWYYDFCKTMKPPPEEQKYIFKETKQKVIYLFLF